MDLGSIFLILALFILVGLFISRPFLGQKAKVVSPEEHEYSTLLAERDRILTALQELDFDFTLGKIPEAEYPAQRAAMLEQGAEVLRRLDATRVDGSRDDLEAAIAARRADAARLQMDPNGASRRTARPVQDDNLEVLIASRRRERREKAAGFCPQCGRPVQLSDRFCPQCGRTVG